MMSTTPFIPIRSTLRKTPVRIPCRPLLHNTDYRDRPLGITTLGFDLYIMTTTAAIFAHRDVLASSSPILDSAINSAPVSQGVAAITIDAPAVVVQYLVNNMYMTGQAFWYVDTSMSTRLGSQQWLDAVVLAGELGLGVAIGALCDDSNHVDTRDIMTAEVLVPHVIRLRQLLHDRITGRQHTTQQLLTLNAEAHDDMRRRAPQGKAHNPLRLEIDRAFCVRRMSLYNTGRPFEEFTTIELLSALTWALPEYIPTIEQPIEARKE